MAQQDPTQDIRHHGEGLVAAALAGDAQTARRHTDFFVLRRHVDEGIPYWERAVAAGDAFSAYTLARYRKIRGSRAEADRLYRSAAEDVRSRYSRDDLDVLARMAAPEKELAAAEAALSAG
ncbi:hypothetical protein ACFWDI_30095 [Streptomyces sp. NPDC060064]|uniref:hypothetical protein n=1 Tax=Streptomyces sp. NPDC060064 TaxID=3347049 RepID=UPI0036C402EE